MVKGSHGLIAADDRDAALWIGSGTPPEGSARIPMTSFAPRVLEALGFGERGASALQVRDK